MKQHQRRYIGGHFTCNEEVLVLIRAAMLENGIVETLDLFYKNFIDNVDTCSILVRASTSCLVTLKPCHWFFVGFFLLVFCCFVVL
jgi:hypothetical protein